jgi:hypothetical protein
MPAQAQVYTTSAIVAATPTFNADVIIASIGPANVDSYGQNVRVQGSVSITAGTSSTAQVLTIRRNSITGQTIGTAQTFPTTAGSTYTLPFSGSRSEPVGNHTYHLVLTQTGATVAGTVGAVGMTAIVGN